MSVVRPPSEHLGLRAMGQREALANAFVLYTPFVLGMALTVLVASASAAPTSFAHLTLGLYATGMVLFLWAKLSLLQRGIRFSTGTALMSPGSRRAYRCGYALMGLGCIATLALVLVLRAQPPT